MNYDELFTLLQQRDVRILKQILPDKKDLSFIAPVEIVKKPSNVLQLTGLRETLDAKLLNTLSLQMCTFHYYDIPLIGHKKPVFLNFTFQDHGKMRFYISRHTPTPNRFNFEEAFQRKQVLKYTEPGDDPIFASQYLYMAVFAQQKSSIQVKLQYGLALKKPKVAQERPQTATYEWRPPVARILKTPRKDLIVQNMNVRQFEPENQKRTLMIRRVQSAKRFNDTLQKKQVIDIEKVEIVKHKFEVSERRKIIKEIMRARDEISDQIEYQQQWWLRFMYVFVVVKNIRSRYFVIQQIKLVMCLGQDGGEDGIAKEEQGQVQNSGMFEIQRIEHQIEDYTGYNVVYKALHSHYLNQGQGYGEIGEIIQKMYKTKRLLKHILECYRNYRGRVAGYKTRIIMLWNKYWAAIYKQAMKEDQELLKQQKLKQNKTVVNLHIEDESNKKAPFLDTKVQNAIVNNYFKAMQLKFHEKMVLMRENRLKMGVLVAAQGFDKKGIVLFQTVDRAVIGELGRKYMLDKRMIQSALLTK